MSDLPQIPIAKVLKTFGVKGELMVRLYDVFPDEVNIKEPVFVMIDGLPVPLFFGYFQKKGTGKAVVIFDDFETSYRASELIGKELLAFGVEETGDEFHYENTAGFTLTDLSSGRTGIINEYLDYANNPLFSVDFGGTEVMVPAAEDLIRTIDWRKKSVEMVLPDGLLDIYLK